LLPHLHVARVMYIGTVHGNQSTLSKMLTDKPFSQSTVHVVHANLFATKGTSSFRLVLFWHLCASYAV